MHPLRPLTKAGVCLVSLAAFFLTSCRPAEENAKEVWLYEYHGMPRMRFTDAVIYEKKPGYIKFKARTLADDEVFIEHSGRYTIEN